MDAVHEWRLSVDRWDKKNVDPWDVKSVHRGAMELIALMKAKGLQRIDIVSDLTGGLTTLSVGAFKAAEEHRIDTQYDRSEYDNEGKRIKGTESAILLTRNAPV